MVGSPSKSEVFMLGLTNQGEEESAKAKDLAGGHSWADRCESLPEHFSQTKEVQATHV